LASLALVFAMVGAVSLGVSPALAAGDDSGPGWLKANDPAVVVDSDVALADPVTRSDGKTVKITARGTQAVAARVIMYDFTAIPIMVLTYRWTRESYWGLTRNTTKIYTWSIKDQRANQSASVQGMGFRSSDGRVTWYYAGQGKKGGATVPWGNTIGIPKIKVVSNIITTVAVGTWR